MLLKAKLRLFKLGKGHQGFSALDVIYEGVQEGCGSVPDFRIFTILQDIPHHPLGSTVSERTLLKAGYELPV